jgi:hypothetical protein
MGSDKVRGGCCVNTAFMDMSIVVNMVHCLALSQAQTHCLNLQLC